jgi:drug/metabolite transporter (DMT)-like permease
MLKKLKQKPVLAFVLAYALWGFNTPMIQIGLKTVPLYPLILFKFGGAGLFFTFLSRKKWMKLKATHWVRVVAATLFGYTLTSVLVYQGIKETGSLNGSLIYLLIPFLVYVLSIEILKDRFSLKLLLGVLTGFVGAGIIVAAPLFTGKAVSHGSIQGNLLLLVGVCTDALGTIAIKPIISKAPVLQITSVRFIIATISILPFALPQLSQLSSVNFSPSVIGALAFNFIGATLIAYYLYHFGLKKISAERTSPLYYIDPVVGTVASIILLNEHMTPVVIAGIILVLIGIYYSEVRKSLFAWQLGRHR